MKETEGIKLDPCSIMVIETKLNNKLHGFSPQAKYTDGAVAAGWLILVPSFVDRVMSRGQCSHPPHSC
jgi:hypothetical protein